MKSLSSKIESFLHWLFEFGVLVKAFNGLWETTSGILLLALGEAVLMARIFHNISPHTKNFAAAYLLIHGLLNIFLAIQLYRNKLWAYLITIGVMIGFLFYQVHRISLYHSQILIYITIFDLFFILLTWHEYRHQIIKRGMR